MKTAILFTGQIRNLARVAGLLRKNLIEPNNAILFFACEGEGILDFFNPQSIGGYLILPTFRTSEFYHLIDSIKNRPATKKEVFERSQKHDGIPWNFDYLVSSGTVLQYYQLWKAYMIMLEYEKTNKFRFDICIRARLDALITEPLSLQSFFQTNQTNELDARSLDSYRIRMLHGRKTNQYEHPWGTPLNKRTVWTLGQEQIWICRRSLFDCFGPMVLSYGLWDSGLPSAFCSEAFFQEFCIANNIVHYAFYEKENYLFNTSHPGTEEIVSDEWVFSLLR